MKKADFDAGVLSDFVFFTMSAVPPRMNARVPIVTGDADVTAGQSWPQAQSYTPMGYSEQ